MGANRPIKSQKTQNGLKNDNLSHFEQKVLKLADIYNQDCNAERFNQHFRKPKEYGKWKSNVSEEHFQGINKDTNVGSIWKEINLFIGK